MSQRLCNLVRAIRRSARDRRRTRRSSGGRLPTWQVLLPASAVLLTYPAFANIPTWTANGPLTYVESVADGTIVLGTSSAVSANCTTAGGGLYFQVGSNGVTLDGIKTITAMAMSALVSGKSVQVLYDATGPTCYATSLAINP